MSTLAPPLPLPVDPAWRSRIGWTLAAIAVLIPAGWLAEFNPAVLWDPSSLRATRQFLATFFPPRVDLPFLQEVAVATWKTVAIATVGTTLAVLLAVPAALVANRTLSLSAFAGGAMCALCGGLRSAIRGVLIVLRSIPEIVWALLIVRAVGLGDTAGVIAIALTYGGMLGKVYIEILESNEAAGTRALLANGASRTQAFLYGLLPACLPELLSYTIYRWECAIRASVVMGFVGAGGLGQQMELAMKMLAGGEVLTMLLVFVALVLCADLVSAWLRQRLA